MSFISNQWPRGRLSLQCSHGQILQSSLPQLAVRSRLRKTTGGHVPDSLPRNPRFGGQPLLYDLLRKLLKREFECRFTGRYSIVTALRLGKYLADSIIVLMLAGGEALEIRGHVRHERPRGMGTTSTRNPPGQMACRRKRAVAGRNQPLPFALASATRTKVASPRP